MLYSSGTTGRPKAVRRPLPTDGNGSWAQSVLEMALIHQLRHDPVERVPVARAAVSRRRRELHHGGQPGRRGVDHHAQVRRRGRAAADRDPPGHPRPVRADHVRADAQAARGGPRQIRRLESAVRDPRGRPVPGGCQAPDDGVVRPDHPRILRRHRGIRGHHDRPRGVARPSRLGGHTDGPGARGRRRRAGASRRGVRRAVLRRWTGVRVLQGPRQDRVGVQRTRVALAWATWATSTRTATCT